MTETPYLDDSYVREFEATVERVHGNRVVLDRTYFYPTGGGQPNDTGRLSADGRTWRVADVEKKDTVYHHLAAPDAGDASGDGTGGVEPPEPVTAVEAAVDWDRRYAHMRYHTAQHLVSAVLLDEFDAETTGNQLYADRARIDVAHPRFDEDDFADVEAAVNGYVEDARPVEWYVMDREEAAAELDPERTRLDLLPDSITEVRIVEVKGVDRTACAGTHVENTEEIGAFEITGRETKGSEEERLEFVVHEA
jgi:misacylated tRNA(Ala) deacylase